ncbi:MAG TPA: FecR domain-containing protein [Niastella sp.]
MNEKLATDLLRRYCSGDCSIAETKLVDAWYNELINTGEVEWEEGESESMQMTIENWLMQNMTGDEIPSPPVSRLRVSSRTWWAAAAVVMLLSGTGYYLFNKQPVSTVATTDAALKNDVAPGSNKAVLTLSNGATIALDDASNGMVAQQGNAKVLKPDDGQLVYSQENNNGDEPLTYNTLATPRSGQYQLVLPDGTKVWLNAESSIHYPVAFIGNERRVQITGEAYFEVATLRLSSGQKMPFIVEKGDVRIEVLGTHFNVNAYNDESAIKTTLLEGKVRVVKGEWSMVNGQSTKKDHTTILKPGEQALIPAKTEKAKQSGNNRILVHKTDVDDVIAWKNGLFHFENADVRTVMRQLARWYDVEVIYEGASVKNDPLFVEISRNTRLSDVLKVLEESGSAKFSIQGKKIIVK